MKNLYNDLIQQKAIDFGTGPACVLAGPGSGKTYIITNRIQKLISKGVNPSQILVITFTKAAAREMKTRFMKLSGNCIYDVTFGTFHSVYLNILKQFTHNFASTIINNYKQKELLANILENSKCFSNNILFSSDNLDDLINAISFYKSCNKIPIEYNNELFAILNEEYENCKKTAGYMDYDDIIIFTHKLLLERTDVREFFKNKYNYILVDEFQDINLIQYETLKLIINSNNNIFAVGDDDQSIYGFRGAKPGIMDDFLSDYPNVEKIELRTNYRSNKKIVSAANKVIEKNLFRLKTLDSVVASSEQGEFKVNLFESKEEELLFIKNMILKYGKDKVCVLTRTNKDVRIITGFLNKNIYSESFAVTDDQIINKIQDIIGAYISFSLNNDRVSALKIIKYPNRFISRDIFVENKVNLNKLIQKYGGTYTGTQLDKLNRVVNLLQKLSPFSFVTYLINYGELKDCLIKEYGNDKREIINNYFNEIIDISKKSLSLSALSDEIKPKYKNKEIITEFNVMTYHASKGLEFDIVLLPGVNEGKVPGRASVATDNIDEERRLFYVAMTRAKKELYISAIKGEGSLRMLPSRFITEFI